MLAGFAVLVVAAALWFAYPRLLQIDVRTVPLNLAFLPWHRLHAPTRLVWPVRTRLGLSLSVFALSYAAPLTAALGLRASRRVGGRSPLSALRQPDVATLTILFALAAFSGLFLLEDNARHASGNLMWGYAVGHIAFLPLVVLGISRIENTFWRRVGWAVYGAHLASGVWNLFLFAYAGMF